MIDMEAVNDLRWKDEVGTDGGHEQGETPAKLSIHQLQKQQQQKQQQKPLQQKQQIKQSYKKQTVKIFE